MSQHAKKLRGAGMKPTPWWTRDDTAGLENVEVNGFDIETAEETADDIRCRLCRYWNSPDGGIGDCFGPELQVEHGEEFFGPGGVRPPDGTFADDACDALEPRIAGGGLIRITIPDKAAI